MAQGHTATKKKGQDLKAGSLVPEPTLSYTPQYCRRRANPYRLVRSIIDEVREMEKVHAF